MRNKKRTRQQRRNKSHSGARRLLWISNSMVCFALLCSQFSAAVVVFTVACRLFPFDCCAADAFLSFSSHKIARIMQIQALNCVLLCVCFAITKMRNCINFYRCLLIFCLCKCAHSRSLSLFSFGSSIIKLSFRLHFIPLSLSLAHPSYYPTIFISVSSLFWFLLRIDIEMESYFFAISQ